MGILYGGDELKKHAEECIPYLALKLRLFLLLDVVLLIEDALSLRGFFEINRVDLCLGGGNILSQPSYPKIFTQVCDSGSAFTDPLVNELNVIADLLELKA